MKRALWILWFAVSYGVCFFLWWKVAPQLGQLGQTVYEGGPLVSILVFLCILVVTFVLERMCVRYRQTATIADLSRNRQPSVCWPSGAGGRLSSTQDVFSVCPEDGCHWCNVMTGVNNPMHADTVKELIEKGFPDAEVYVKGEGDHFEAIVISASFDGETRVRQHQRVYECLGDLIQTASARKKKPANS